MYSFELYMILNGPFLFLILDFYVNGKDKIAGCMHGGGAHLRSVDL